MLLATATVHLLVPMSAEAHSPFFTLRTWYIGNEPPFVSNGFRRAGIGCIGATPTAPRFTVPQSHLKDTTFHFACTAGYCPNGYPESKAWYSYWNLKGDFRPNNPHGASTTTTIRFNTTMLDRSEPPHASGEPVTPTTTFGGRYDFSRAGSIKITPGPNRFSGTMRFFYGPNHRFYQLLTLSSPYISKAYGYPVQTRTTYDPSGVGESAIGRRLHRYRMTT
jgi:hypothetical protein